MQSTGLAHAEYIPSSGCSLSMSPLDPAVESLPELPELVMPVMLEVSLGSLGSLGADSDSSEVVESDEVLPVAVAVALADPDALVNVVG